MKRYLLFAGDQYYPLGGWSDFIGDFDTEVEAACHVPDRSPDWKHIFDTETRRIIWHWSHESRGWQPGGD